MEQDIYVVVAETDGIEDGAIVMETEADGATVEKANERVKKLAGRYGECRIAKLTFIEEN